MLSYNFAPASRTPCSGSGPPNPFYLTGLPAKPKPVYLKTPAITNFNQQFYFMTGMKPSLRRFAPSLRRSAFVLIILLISATPGTTADSSRDGSHDFDFGVGTWKTHIRRLLHPLTGSNAWATLDGTVVTRKIWKGRAQLEEIEADGSNGHFEGLNLFLYNPQAHQWSLTWSSSSDGILGIPTIGEFKNGRAEIFDQETLNGRTILARGIWSEIRAKTHRFEQAYSDDGGKTWETNFIAEKTLENPEPIILSSPVMTAASSPAAATTATTAGTATGTAATSLRDGQHDFDFDFGTWNIHIRRLRHPLTDSSSWFEMNGTTTISKVWGGKANIAEVEADGPSGDPTSPHGPGVPTSPNAHLELLALRLYNPQAHQWAISFATSNVGTLSVPSIGEFHNGVGEFIDQEPYGDRTILVHFIIQSLTAQKAHSEQAFSNDGGKTWETNWINDYTHVAR
jgi:hypothetical protein